MPREYRHIELYEKEIIHLWEEGKTLRQIGEMLGFTHKQKKDFKTKYNYIITPLVLSTHLATYISHLITFL